MTPVDGEPDLIFYDGACGLCHASVRFALARDADGSRFRYAPIGGAAWRRLFPDATTAPRSTFVLHAAGGATLVRSDASLRVLARIGGGWGKLAAALRWIPRPLRDLGYALIAAVRRALLRRPTDPCPTPDPRARTRFDLEP
jgi:predicted DCC family thiol-disulfide oxidoreductase YuxK